MQVSFSMTGLGIFLKPFFFLHFPSYPAFILPGYCVPGPLGPLWHLRTGWLKPLPGHCRSG